MCAQTHTHSNNTHNSDRDQTTPATVTLSQESPTVSLSSTATAATTGHFSDIVPYTDCLSTCRAPLALLPTMKLTFPPTAPVTDSSVASFVLCHITHTMRLAYSLASGVGFSLTGIRLRFSPCSLILSPFTHSPTTTTPGLTCPPAICTDISPIQPLMAVSYDSASDITQPISAGQISGENLSLPSSTVSCGGNEHDLAAAYPSVEPTSSTDDGSTVTSATAVAVQPVTTASSSFNECGSFIDLDSAVDPSSSHMSNTPSVITKMSTESGGLIPETANSAETRAVMIPSNHSSETVAPMIQSAYSAETCAQMVQSNHSAETCAPMIQSVITGAPIVTSNHSSETGTPMTHSVETGAVMVQVHSTESAETGVLMVPSVTSTEHRARADSGALTPDTHSENCAEIDSTEAGILFHSTTFPETVAPVTPTYSTHVYESVPSIRALVQTSANAGTTSPTARESSLLDPSHSSVAHTSSNQFTYSHQETVSPSMQSTSASLTEEKHSFTAQNTSSHVPTPPSSSSSPSYVSLTDFTGLGAGPEVMATEQLSSIPDPELEYCYSDISLHNPPSPCILYSPSCSVDSLVAVTSQYNPSTPPLYEPLFPAHSVPQLHRGTFTTTHSRSVPNLPHSNRVHQSPSLLLQHVLSHLFIFACGPESLAPADTEEQVLIPRESVWASAAQLTHDIDLSSSESDHGEDEQGDGVNVGTAQVSNEKEYESGGEVRNGDDNENEGVDGDGGDECDVDGETGDDECDVDGEDECNVDGETGDEHDVDGESGDECDDVEQKDIGFLSMNKGKEGQGYGLDVDVDCKAQDFDVNKQQNPGTGGGLEGAGHSKDGESDGEDDDEYSSSDDADSSADDEYDHSQDDDSDRADSHDSADNDPPTPVYKTRSVRRSFTYLFVPSHSAPAALGAGSLTPLTTQPQNTKPQQTEV